MNCSLLCKGIVILVLMMLEDTERTLEAALGLLPLIRHINDLHFHHIAAMRQSGSSFPDLHDEVFRTKV
jgi:hypothetical protein